MYVFIIIIKNNQRKVDNWFGDMPLAHISSFPDQESCSDNSNACKYFTTSRCPCAAAWSSAVLPDLPLS